MSITITTSVIVRTDIWNIYIQLIINFMTEFR
jgi:hypothetical protein